MDIQMNMPAHHGNHRVGEHHTQRLGIRLHARHQPPRGVAVEERHREPDDVVEEPSPQHNHHLLADDLHPQPEEVVGDQEQGLKHDIYRHRAQEPPVVPAFNVHIDGVPDEVGTRQVHRFRQRQQKEAAHKPLAVRLEERQ
jgi:hypothetical protein